jgi:hypothetical protein
MSDESENYSPLKCPVCKSDDMSREDIDESNGFLSMYYICHDGHRWRETWKFVEYELS